MTKKTSPYDPLWAHIEDCDHCSWAMHRLCDEGRRKLERASKAASELLAPIPALQRSKVKA